MARQARRSAGVDFMDAKYVAEFLGTLTLILVGCGAIALGGMAPGPNGGTLSIGLAFGLTVTAMAYSIGIVSGAHLNPAVTLAMWMAGRMRDRDVPGYIVAQCLGAIVAAGVIVLILYLRATNFNLGTANLGQNGFTATTNLAIAGVALTEFVGTLIFALVIIGATSGKGATPFPGLVIGLTLAALHLAFVAASSCGVNPARSLGPALWVGIGGNTTALGQLVLFILAPAAGGLVAGWLARIGVIDS